MKQAMKKTIRLMGTATFALTLLGMGLGTVPAFGEEEGEGAGEIVITTPDGSQVLHLAPDAAGSGAENLPRGDYILKVESPGKYILRLAGPTRLEIRRKEQPEEHAHDEPRKKTVDADGPVHIDFDLDGGDQEQRVLEIAPGTDQVELQLTGKDLPAVYGYSIIVAYDPEHLSFAPTGFKPGNFVPGLIPLLLPADGSVEVGGANFTKNTASGDGDLGYLTFGVLNGFDGETVIKLTAVKLQTPEGTEQNDQETYGKIVSLGGSHTQQGDHDDHGDHGDHGDNDDHGDHGDTGDNDDQDHTLGGEEALKALMEDRACPKCDLHGANLMREDFDGADLEGANLAGANLFRSSLNDAKLAGANLAGANLLQAKLKNADLSNADLSAARLTGAQLQGADLTDADLTDAKLSGTNLTGAIWPDGKECARGSIGRCR
jgi:hypothetical protein